MKKIIFYEKENGKIPIKDFLINLKMKNRSLESKILYKIDMLGLDNLGECDVKYLKDKIYELRVFDNSNISRVFYFYYSAEKIIILDGFIKKDNKLKQSILNKVIEYKNDYVKRIG